MEAVVLAGGFGNRLKSVVQDVPKPMANIQKQPFLEYLLKYLISQDIDRVILSVGYKHEIIQNYFGNQYQKLNIQYVIEDSPLGTGGAIRKSLQYVTGQEVFILNGDSFFAINYAQFYKTYSSLNTSLALSLKAMENFDRYGIVNFENNRVTGFEEKTFRESGYINGGVYIIKKDLLNSFSDNSMFSFETDFLQKELEHIKIGIFLSNDYFIDIGIPEDYTKAQRELPDLFKRINS